MTRCDKGKDNSFIDKDRRKYQTFSLHLSRFVQHFLTETVLSYNRILSMERRVRETEDQHGNPNPLTKKERKITHASNL